MCRPNGPVYKERFCTISSQNTALNLAQILVYRKSPGSVQTSVILINLRNGAGHPPAVLVWACFSLFFSFFMADTKIQGGSEKNISDLHCHLFRPEEVTGSVTAGAELGPWVPFPLHRATLPSRRNSICSHRPSDTSQVLGPR